MTAFVAPLHSRALISLGGPDWRSFLQGLITQDVETLAPGEARFGALLTPQGRLLYDLFVVGTDDGALLDVAAEHRDALLQRLTIYRLRAKVELAVGEEAVLAAFPEASGEGWVRDPRLPELGWRGYGLNVAPDYLNWSEMFVEIDNHKINVDDRLVKSILEIICRIQPWDFGFGLDDSDSADPGLYVMSAMSRKFGREESDRLLRWYETSHETRLIKIRDVFQYNILSDRYLSISVEGGTTLRDYINSAEGTELSPVANDSWLWRVPSSRLSIERARLSTKGLLIAR